VVKYLQTKKVPFTSIMTTMYFSNFTAYGFIRKEGDEFVVQLPIPSNTKVESYNPHDTGSWALTAFKSEPTGKTFHAFGERLSPNEFAETLRRVSGKKIRVQDVTVEQFESNEFKQVVGEELWLNMKAFHDGGFHFLDYKKSREENPNAQNFEEFAKTNPELKALMGY